MRKFCRQQLHTYTYSIMGILKHIERERECYNEFPHLHHLGSKFCQPCSIDLIFFSLLLRLHCCPHLLCHLCCHPFLLPLLFCLLLLLLLKYLKQTSDIVILPINMSVCIYEVFFFMITMSLPHLKVLTIL